MNSLSPLAQTIASPALRSSKLLYTTLSACALSFSLAATSQAAPITGDPVTNTFGWTPNSTNALNYAEQTPNYNGDETPYVLFTSNAPGSVTLTFYSSLTFPGNLSYFERRIDGVDPTTGTPHPVVSGDVIRAGTYVSATTSDTRPTTAVETFFADDYIDIRLALGGERDFDFDWVRFEVQPVPLPAAAWLFASALLGLGVLKRKKA